ncbi:type II toxin-antitoxin system HipA family toxin [Agromyces sp. SYSU T00194]|uniref:type II toxin-antitoxin system HipA family toxin n=1 Tax=Agromyces chitinivorans TaxID=3158560 RepID=UPI003391B82B
MPETVLNVELHGDHVGTLRGDRDGFDFQADVEAVRSYGLGSRVLSVAVPLVARANPRNRGIRANFFAELLPEGRARDRLAVEAGVRRDDVLGMLAAYGRDVAGALQIWNPEQPGEPRTPAVEPVDDAGVRQMLAEVAIAPLGNKPRRGKTSLNGVQSKIVLVRTETGWARALDGYPSTHIVKPIVGEFPTMIFDEEYGSRFARDLGLATFDTRLQAFDGVMALVIERYDRSAASPDGRVHQEDFSQVLGLSGDDKYETYGGVGLSSVASQLDRADRERLLRMLTLSVAVGNLDFHAKNISLLHDRVGGVELAPMYDIVPQTHYDNDGEMAFRVAGEFQHRLLTRAHLIDEANSWKVQDASALIDGALDRIRAIATAESPHAGAHPGLQQTVIRFTDNLAAGRAAGDDGDGTFDPELGSAAPRPTGWIRG